MGGKRVAVLGGGIIGVSSALRIKTSLKELDVTLVSDKFSPETTGDVAAGLLMPYSLGPDSETVIIRKWFQETFDFFQEIALSSEADSHGVCFIHVMCASQETKSNFSDYLDIFLDYHPMNEKQLSLFPPENKYGWHGTSMTVECKRLLPKFMKRFEDLGGKTKKMRVENLRELSGSFDIVVNCTGIGAGKLVPDPDVYPVRGQVIKVKAPWAKAALITDRHHILPNTDVVTLGGTKQESNWCLEPNDEDKEDIWKECCRILPSLKNAEVIGDCVGLRPVRNCPRIEKDPQGKEKYGVTVIHNYGHGGSGITLSWGCAREVVSLVESAIEK